MKSYQEYDVRYTTAYANGMKSLTSHRADPLLVKYLIHNMALTANVLEIGCGEGFEAKVIAEIGYSVTAIDCSVSAISRAREINSHQNVTYLNIDFIADSEIHLKENYSFVYDIGCFHMLAADEERRSYLKNIRAVASGGLYYICHGVPDEEWDKHEFLGNTNRTAHSFFVDDSTGIGAFIPSEPFIQPIPTQTLTQLLEEFGFQVLKKQIRPGRVFPLEQCLLLKVGCS